MKLKKYMTLGVLAALLITFSGCKQEFGEFTYVKIGGEHTITDAYGNTEVFTNQEKKEFMKLPEAKMVAKLETHFRDAYPEVYNNPGARFQIQSVEDTPIEYVPSEEAKSLALIPALSGTVKGAALSEIFLGLLAMGGAAGTLYQKYKRVKEGNVKSRAAVGLARVLTQTVGQAPTDVENALFSEKTTDKEVSDEIDAVVAKAKGGLITS